jgi:spermidine synthase
MNSRRELGRNALLAIFTLSGFSGLIYESIWSHYMQLFLGHAAYAQTLVLTVFMGGMALGAWLAARLSPRLRSLLLAYAVVEMLTGAFALVFHPAYLGAVGLTFGTVIPALDAPTAVNAAKWAVATLLILPQSILLGATFPFISGGVVRRFPQNPGATLAMLYFTNSLGAAFGVLASGFVLIERVGLPGTVMIAGIVNVALGLMVWLLRGAEPAPPRPVDSNAANPAAARVLARRILAVAFLSGVAAFVYEIAWIRMLSMVLGSSTHAFELMLSAFIMGLAGGGWFIRRRIDGLGNPLGSLALMFAVMAVLATLTLPLYGFTFDVVGAAMRAFPPTDAGYTAFNFLSHGIAAAVMIPTTFVAGMTLPVMTHVLLRSADESAIGRVYASNTVGAIVGVLIGVHLLLPLIGLKGAILFGACVQLGTALLLQPRLPTLRESSWARGAFAAGVLLVTVTALFVELDPMRMAAGVYRKGQARLPEGSSVIFLRDGKTATISLARSGETVTIATNGKPDAAIHMGAPGNPNPDEITMTLAAALPLAMHRSPRHVANIGLGSGLTSHVVLASDQVERLDSIEIEPMMAAAARAGFGVRVSRVFQDRRSHMYFEDAKTFFSAGKRRYDVIISEPSNPWISGVATLFSDEFYSQARNYLEPDGLLVQWIQIYETDLTVAGSIFKALSPHFKDYVVYSTDNANILIVASPDAAVPPLQHDLFAEPALAHELRLAGLDAMGDLELRRIGDKRMLDALMTGFPVPANSDFHPYVDLNAPRMRFLGRDALELVRLGDLPVPVAEILGQPLARSASDSAASARFFLRHRYAIEARNTMNAIFRHDPQLAPVDGRAPVEVLLRSPESCAVGQGRHEWLTAVHSVASKTTPFLPPAERAPLWETLRGSPCATTLSPPQREWLQLLEAMGGGDTAAVGEHGLAMLRDPPAELQGEQVLQALIATAAARIAVSRPGDARELLDAYLPSLQSAGDYTLALRLVDALARPVNP